MPLLAPPPASFVNKLCSPPAGHVWADRIDIRPIFGVPSAPVLSALQLPNFSTSSDPHPERQLGRSQGTCIDKGRHAD